MRASAIVPILQVGEIEAGIEACPESQPGREELDSSSALAVASMLLKNIKLCFKRLCKRGLWQWT